MTLITGDTCNLQVMLVTVVMLVNHLILKTVVIIQLMQVTVVKLVIQVVIGNAGDASSAGKSVILIANR